MTIEEIKSFRIGFMPDNQETREQFARLQEWSLQYSEEEWKACRRPGASFFADLADELPPNDVDTTDTEEITFE